MTYACDMNALTPMQRQRHGELAIALRPQVINFEELHDGYAAKFGTGLESELSEFGTLEKLCCPFFSISLSSHQDCSVLSITGDGDIKPFMRAEFGINVA